MTKKKEHEIDFIDNTKILNDQLIKSIMNIVCFLKNNIYSLYFLLKLITIIIKLISGMISRL